MLRKDAMERAASKGPQKEPIVDVVRRNWRVEVETAEVYRDLAAQETNEKRKGILLRMAEAEERHAKRWEQKLADLGFTPPVRQHSFIRRLNRWWNRIAGTEIAIRRMEAAEDRDEMRYREQQDRGTSDRTVDQEFLREIAIEEKAHARALNMMAGQIGPKTALDSILRRERWHG